MKYRQPSSLVEFAGKSGTLNRSTDLQSRSEEHRFGRDRHATASSAVVFIDDSYIRSVNHCSERSNGRRGQSLRYEPTSVAGRTFVPAERQAMSLPVKIDQASLTKRRSIAELVSFKTSSKAVLKVDRLSVGHVASTRGPGKVG